jgi:hypothetical protein
MARQIATSGRSDRSYYPLLDSGVGRNPVGRAQRGRAESSDDSHGVVHSTEILRRESGQLQRRSDRLSAQKPLEDILSGEDSPRVVTGSRPSAPVLEPEAQVTLDKPRRGPRVCAGVIEFLGSAVAVFLIFSALLAVGGANPGHEFTRITGVIAPYLATGFMDLFQPAEPTLALVLNYGSAAAFWLVATILIARLIRKVSA